MQEWTNRESAQLHGEMGPPSQLHLIKVVSFADLPNRQVFPPWKVRRPTHMRLYTISLGYPWELLYATMFIELFDAPGLASRSAFIYGGLEV
jgi:hypothetical protein